MRVWRWAAAVVAGLIGAGSATAQSPPAALEGDWAGTLKVGALSLRLVLHVHGKVGGAPGDLAATMDSPDQGALGLPTLVTLEDGKVRLKARGAAGAFVGTLGADGSALTGQWSGLPLTLTRQAAGQAPVTLNRPQTPTPPYPYTETEVRFASLEPGVALAGTFTRPPGGGPFPAVALISGSGPQTRDEVILGHQIFRVLADHLARRGVAVLRWDKRGLGGSSGDYATATTTDFARDAQGAAAWLRTQADVDPTRVGLIGHSEGGLVSPMVALADSHVAFIVMLAGPGVSGDRIIVAQGRAIAAAAGAPAAVLDRNAELQRRLIAAVTAAKDTVSAEAAALSLLKSAGLPDEVATGQARAAASPWYRAFLAHDPAPDLRRLRIPVLALVGEKDLQVPPDLNLPALRAALADDPKAVVEGVPDVNHLFQNAVTGAPSEYGQIEETMSPVVLDRISRWILTQPSRAIAP